jgi:hypothetical protein
MRWATHICRISTHPLIYLIAITDQEPLPGVDESVDWSLLMKILYRR